MLFFMYLALLLPENNPVVDEHIVYILVLALIAFKNDAVHDWIFSHFDDNRAGIVAHGDIGEQFGRVEVLKRLVGRYLSPLLAGA